MCLTIGVQFSFSYTIFYQANLATGSGSKDADVRLVSEKYVRIFTLTSKFKKVASIFQILASISEKLASKLKKAASMNSMHLLHARPYSAPALIPAILPVTRAEVIL